MSKQCAPVHALAHTSSPRGNAIIIAATASVILALTWGGVKYSWTSHEVLPPLVIGFVGIGAFLIYEMYVASEPVVPRRLLGNRTSFSGYVLVSQIGHINHSVLRHQICNNFCSRHGRHTCCILSPNLLPGRENLIGHPVRRSNFYHRSTYW